MKKFLFVFVVVVVGITGSFSLSAQENDSETGTVDLIEVSNPALKLSLRADTQRYPSREVPIKLEINSDINSDKVAVDWSYSTKLLAIVGDKRDTVSVRQGQTTYVEKLFIPYESVANANRTVEVGVTVNGFVAEQNYLSSTKIQMQINPDGEVFPVAESYQNAKTLDTVKTWAIRIVVVLIILAGIGFGIKKFIDYLNSEDDEEVVNITSATT